MDTSDYRSELKQALIITPLSKIDPKSHWLYVPEDLRKKILKALESLGIPDIAEVIGLEADGIERWVEEEQSLAKLIECLPPTHSNLRLVPKSIEGISIILIPCTPSYKTFMALLQRSGSRR